MRLADAHLHLFRNGYAGLTGPKGVHRDELGLYEALRKRHRIDAGLVVGYEGQARYRGNNDDLERWARRRSWIHPVAFVPCDPPPRLDFLASLRRRGFVGLALYVSTASEARRVARWPRPVMEWFRRHPQILSLNARPAALEELQAFLERAEPHMALLSHVGLPGPYARPPAPRKAREKLGPLLQLASMPCVGVKISGLYAISDPSHAYPHPSARPFLEAVYGAFGPSRLYWGSDFSPALEHVSFPQTIEALVPLGWPAPALRQILGENLRRLLRQRERIR
jgi:L-fuconolactonase